MKVFRENKVLYEFQLLLILIKSKYNKEYFTIRFYKKYFKKQKYFLNKRDSMSIYL